MTLQLLEPSALLKLTAAIELDAERPELLVRLTATGEIRNAIRYPAPFVTQPGTLLILPVNEGISYPVDDATLPPMHYHLYGGHGLCMAWWGVDRRRGGPDGHRRNAGRRGRPHRRAATACCACARVGCRRRASSATARRLRYVFFDEGGYVAMCKRYRAARQAERPVQDPGREAPGRIPTSICWSAR